MKVNPVFINPDGESNQKSMCGVCKQHRIFIADKLKCPSCGGEQEPNREQGQFLKNEYKSEPMIVSKKSASMEKKRDADLPAGSYWVEKD